MTLALSPEAIPSEEDLLRRVLQNNPAREIRIPSGVRWGKRLLPAANERHAKCDQGLRILLIGSWTLGFLILETLKVLERGNPTRFNIVGLVTDDPMDPDAKISLKKRF